MTADRLSALDESFLRIESRAAHMHVGWTLLVEGEPPTTIELREQVASRLELLPRFRRRVMTSRIRLHDPVWVDDPQFDIVRHVRRVPLADPGGPAELRALAGGLLSVPLDRRRPLWRIYLIDGLRDRRFAIVGQAHHALVDGIAAVEVAQLLLDAEPAAPRALPRRWTPARTPGLLDRALASAGERARVGRTLGSLALRALADPATVGEGIAELRRIGSALSAIGTAAPPTLLNRPIGPVRSVAFADLSLEAAKDVGRRAGATVNDVLLATAALALGRHLRHAGQSHPWLRVLVPVSTRAPRSCGELGNRISVVFVELPIGQRDPRAALQAVCAQTREHKRADVAGGLDGVLRAAALAPAQLRDALAWLVTRPQTFNAVVSNIPGPKQPLYLLGRPVRAAYPAVPLVQGHGLSIGVLSYCGVLHVGLYAHPGVVPEVIEVARDLTSSFDALRFAFAPTSPAPEPAPFGSGAELESRVLV
jgi:WS/DGAT/MGAT family acyltransferase